MPSFVLCICCFWLKNEHALVATFRRKQNCLEETASTVKSSTYRWKLTLYAAVDRTVSDSFLLTVPMAELQRSSPIHSVVWDTDERSFPPVCGRLLPPTNLRVTYRDHEKREILISGYEKRIHRTTDGSFVQAYSDQHQSIIPDNSAECSTVKSTVPTIPKKWTFWKPGPSWSKSE